METYEMIKKFRLDNKLTQAQFGGILNCDRYRIADIERGKTAPTIEDIKVISKKFNVSSDYLLGLSDGTEINDDANMISRYIGLSTKTVTMLINGVAKQNQLKEYYIKNNLDKFTLEDDFEKITKIEDDMQSNIYEDTPEELKKILHLSPYQTDDFENLLKFLDYCILDSKILGIVDYADMYITCYNDNYKVFDDEDYIDDIKSADLDLSLFRYQMKCIDMLKGMAESKQLKGVDINGNNRKA